MAAELSYMSDLMDKPHGVASLVRRLETMPSTLVIPRPLFMANFVFMERLARSVEQDPEEDSIIAPTIDEIAMYGRARSHQAAVNLQAPDLPNMFKQIKTYLRQRTSEQIGCQFGISSEGVSYSEQALINDFYEEISAPPHNDFEPAFRSGTYL